jgi:hypothetical protein
LNPAEQGAGFAETLSGQTRVGRAARIGRCAPHFVLSLTQTVVSLLRGLLRPRARRRRTAIVPTDRLEEDD